MEGYNWKMFTVTLKYHFSLPKLYFPDFCNMAVLYFFPIPLLNHEKHGFKYCNPIENCFCQMKFGNLLVHHLCMWKMPLSQQRKIGNYPNCIIDAPNFQSINSLPRLLFGPHYTIQLWKILFLKLGIGVVSQKLSVFKHLRHYFIQMILNQLNILKYIDK